MTPDDCIRLLRTRGCRCALMWNGQRPIPFTLCDIKLGDRKECWFIDSLKFALQKESNDRSST